MGNKRKTLQQVKTLTIKNFRLFFRSTGSIITIVFIPLLIVCSLFFFAWLIEKTKADCIDLDTKVYPNSQIPRCLVPETCKSVVYFVIEKPESEATERILESDPSFEIPEKKNPKPETSGNNFQTFNDLIQKSTENLRMTPSIKGPSKEKNSAETERSVLEDSFKPKKLDRIRKIMTLLADNNSLKMERDIEEVRVHSSREISEYTRAHRNQTQIAYIFCTSEWDISFNDMNLNIPCSFDNLQDRDMLFYSVHYNVTYGVDNPFMFSLSSGYPLNHLLVSAKKELDRAIIQSTADTPDFEFELSTKGFPTTTCLRFEGYDFISNFGSFFLYLPSAVFLALTLSSDSFSSSETC